MARLSSLRFFFLTVAMALAPLRAAIGCGPFFSQAMFTFDRHPDFPLPAYAAGTLGVILGTYARSYLVVAYRTLSATPLDAAEQQAALGLWTERLGYGTGAEAAGASVEGWLAARREIPGANADPEIRTDKEVPGTEYFTTYLNCPADAFITAARTLRQRSTASGAASTPVRDWLAAQDMVFATCGEALHMPPAADPGATPLIRADRTYQQAAAHFYAGDFRAAEDQFGAIAADTASPWRSLAAYLVARTLVRQGTLGAGEGKIDLKALERADAEIGTILADASRQALHPAALRLRDFVRFRTQPTARRAELARAITIPGNGAALQQRLADYTLLLDKLTGDDPFDVATPPPLPPDAVDDLTEWILTLQSQEPAATERAVGRWREIGSLPWLLAALSHVPAQHPAVLDLLAAAAKLDARSPAYPTAMHRSVRLLLARGDRAAARLALDRLLTQPALLPTGTVNLLLAERLPLATSLEEFARDLERIPVAVGYDAGGVQLPDDVDGNAVLEAVKEPRGKAIDETAARFLNESMPVTARTRLLDERTLSDGLRGEIAVASWVRAVLLKDTARAQAYALQVSAASPELAETIARYLSAPRTSQHFTAVFALLRTPGLSPDIRWGIGRSTPLSEIDNFRDNWWCSNAASAGQHSPLPTLTFLSDGEREAARREWSARQSLPTGPNYFAAETLAFAQAHPEDPRLPEALHLVVRATRYGCTDGETSAWSKKAFQLLHRRYGTSEWAIKTKYHY